MDLWEGCKLACEIRAGDILVGLDSDGRRAPQRVVDVFGGLQPARRVIHAVGEFIASESHKIFLGDGSVVTVASLQPGQHLLGESGESIEIAAVFDIGTCPVFGWNCEPDHVFFAGGLLHHNKITLPSRTTAPP